MSDAKIVLFANSSLLVSFKVFLLDSYSPMDIQYFCMYRVAISYLAFFFPSKNSNLEGPYGLKRFIELFKKVAFKTLQHSATNPLIL